MITEAPVDTDALLAEIRTTVADWRKAEAALPDLRDLPGSLTDRQKAFERERRLRLPQHVGALNTLAEQVAKHAATIATFTPVADKVRGAKGEIERQLADAEQTSTRQHILAASLKAIERDVEHMNGVPMLPTILRELMTATCPTCGHAELTWAGSLPAIEAKIAAAEQALALVPGSLAHLRASVEPWLQEPTMIKG
jgi:hypothetical protein